MERPSIWVIIVVLLLGVLFLREPRFQRSEEYFLRWLIRHSQPTAKAVPITIVETGRENPPAPLEVALLLQGILEFKPTVVAIEPILQWGERSKDQEQIFIDQAMRVPKLVLGAELTATPDPDEPVAEIPGFTRVTGRRGDLPAFSGIERQPGEDIRTRLVLTRVAPNAPDVFAAAIGAIQANSFVRRVSWIFDCAMVILAAALSGALRRFSRVDLIIGAIAFSAAYCLIALAIISRFSIWIPAWLPLGATWIPVLFAIVLPKPKDSVRTVAIAAPPPAL